MTNTPIHASELAVEVYVYGHVWWGGNLIEPETGYHCVFAGNAEDYSNSGDLSASDGSADEALDWDKSYVLYNGEKFHDIADLPCEWD